MVFDLPASAIRSSAILLLSTLVLLSAGCAAEGAPVSTTISLSTTTTLATTTSDPTIGQVAKEQLVGSWQLSTGYVVTFYEDDTWEVADPPSLGDPFDGGSYDLEASILTVVSTAEYGEGCQVNAEGAFELSPGESQDEIQMSSLGDLCVDRRNDFTRGLTRYEP